MMAVVIASVVSLVVALLGTPMFITYLVKQGYGQFIRDDGPTSHHTKRGTPTMGGAVIITATVVAYFFAHLVTWSRPTVSALLVLFLMAGLGAVGFADDYIKISKQRSLGLRSHEKLIGQTAVAVLFAVLALQFPNEGGRTPASTRIPGPAGQRMSSMRPDPGVSPVRGSSLVMRSSMRLGPGCA